MPLNRACQGLKERWDPSALTAQQETKDSKASRARKDLPVRKDELASKDLSGLREPRETLAIPVYPDPPAVTDYLDSGACPDRPDPWALPERMATKESPANPERRATKEAKERT